MDISYYKKYEPIDGKWYITKELGSGAFGTVFEITRKDYSNMKAALKVISIPSTQSEVDSYREENYELDNKSVTSYFYEFVEEFTKEIQLMAELRGANNIVNIEDYDVKEKEGEFGWDIFIRMELLTPMNRYFAENAPKQSDVVKLGIDICKALEVCQKCKMLHRDIKPGNIFISKTGDFKLGDFGVARTLEKTSSGLSKKGTYTYMAPEVFKGEAYGANVDIYSLGIVMYRLLNNNFEPFRHDKTFHDGEQAFMRRMKGENIPKPQNAEGKLAEIVLKACAFDPKDRHESPMQMRMELESVLYHQNEVYEPDCEVTSSENMPEEEEGKTVGIFSEEDEARTASVFSNIDEDENCQPDVTTESKSKEILNEKPLYGNGRWDKMPTIIAITAMINILCCYVVPVYINMIEVGVFSGISAIEYSINDWQYWGMLLGGSAVRDLFALILFGSVNIAIIVTAFVYKKRKIKTRFYTIMNFSSCLVMVLIFIRFLFADLLEDTFLGGIFWMPLFTKILLRWCGRFSVFSAYVWFVTVGLLVGFHIAYTVHLRKTEK